MSETSEREAAIHLADELREALDDPNRGEWGGYPWEHLGDAERDVRVLLAELAAAREREAVLVRDFNALLIHSSKARTREEKLRGALRNLPLWKLDDEEDAVSVKTAREAIEGGEHDPDYSPAYQDEYQRLWHKTAQERATLRRAAIDFCANETLQVYGRRWYELTHLLLPNGNEGLDAEGIRERLAALSEGEG